MLRLVRDEPPRQRRRGHRPQRVLSPEQERAAKAALRGLSKRAGSQRKLSAALGLHPDTIVNVLGKRGRVTADVLLRAAFYTKTPVEVLITPGPREVIR